jgi:hypothetical protein
MLLGEVDFVTGAGVSRFQSSHRRMIRTSSSGLILDRRLVFAQIPDFRRLGCPHGRGEDDGDEHGQVAKTHGILPFVEWGVHGLRSMPNGSDHLPGRQQ